MLTTLLEAAFRSALMAVAVWAGIRLLRVHHARAQKLAWVLVLLAAVLMPMVMRAPFLALNRAIRIPLRGVPTLEPLEDLAEGLMLSQPFGVRVAGGILMDDSLPVRPVAREFLAPSKPPAAHREGSPEPVLQSTPGWHHRSQSSVAVQVASAGSPSQRRQTGTNADKAAGLGEVAKARPEPAAIVTWSRIRLLLSLTYCAVLAVLLFRTFAAAAVAFGIWKRSVPISSDLFEDWFATAKTQLPVRVSADLASPVTIGSTILLPANFAAWDRDKLRVVLAHEQSHVRQGDFYLQLAAATHAAIFWFSPLGWWLKRKLSELGETLSDRAGLEQATSPASYAQILLEFAAIPHKPYAGVAMARTSNLSSRIDRILSERHTRLAFPTGRRSAVLTALLVPAALLAVIGCIRIVPSVEAAQTQNANPLAVPGSTATLSSSRTESATQSSGVMNQEAVSETRSLTVEKQSSESASGQVTSTGEAQQNDTAVAPVAPVAPTPPPGAGVMASEAPEPPEADAAPSEEGPRTHTYSHGFAYATNDDGDGSFAIVNGKDSDVTLYGKNSKALEEAKRKYHNNFIWFERDGKSYVITDPAIVAQSEAMFRNDPQLEARKRILQSRMDKFNQEMKQLQPEIEKASKPGPEFEAQMAQLNKQLAELQSDKFKHLTEEINKAVAEQSKDMDATIQKLTQEKMESLGELQERIGEIQGQLGEIQGKIGERQGMMGEKQGEIGERMGKVGEQMGEIGEEEGRKAEEASRKLKSILDQAYKEGKAKPVD